MDREKFQELVLQQFEQLNDRLDKVDCRLDKVESHLDKVDCRLDKVESRLDKVDSRLKTLDSTVAALDSKVTQINREIGQLRQSQAHMENELTEHIRGLWEFQKVQSDVNNRILAALERIENKIETHDIQIQILDKTKSNKRRAK